MVGHTGNPITEEAETEKNGFGVSLDYIVRCYHTGNSAFGKKSSTPGSQAVSLLSLIFFIKTTAIIWHTGLLPLKNAAFPFFQ